MVATQLGNLAASRRLARDEDDPPWSGILGEMVAAGCARRRWLAGWLAGCSLTGSLAAGSIQKFAAAVKRITK
jgi:hypothetical protein